MGTRTIFCLLRSVLAPLRAVLIYRKFIWCCILYPRKDTNLRCFIEATAWTVRNRRCSTICEWKKDRYRAEIDDNNELPGVIPEMTDAMPAAFQWRIRTMGKLLERIEQLPEQPGVKFYLLPRL